uniref:SCP domain-containing protein n=1 Tax=Opuntia streptacantha TaxID=393608 RepID=A0A7C9DSE9_OPUST
MTCTKKISTFPYIFAITLALLQVCHAQNSPQDYVKAHNEARQAVGVKDIEWDDKVANYAEDYANQRKADCALQHSSGPYGENLAEGSGNFTGTDAVQLWVNEKADYDYGSNSCAPGKVCGHYTQVVWRNSTRLGCARVQCENNGWYFVICNYDPPGNVRTKTILNLLQAV